MPLTKVGGALVLLYQIHTYTVSLHYKAYYLLCILEQATKKVCLCDQQLKTLQISVFILRQN